MIFGVSALLRYNDLWLFEIQKEHKWEQLASGHLAIGMGCIGGSVESGETPVEALQREAQEEIGCQLVLDTPGELFSISPDFEITRENQWLPEGVRFFWEGSGPGFVKGGKVAVVTGHPNGVPQPGDLPGVIGLSSELLLGLESRDATLQDALTNGAEVIEKMELPKEAILNPVGTAKILIELNRREPDIVAKLLTLH